MRCTVLFCLAGLLLRCAAPVQERLPAPADPAPNPEESQATTPAPPPERPRTGRRRQTFYYYPDVEIYWSVESKRYAVHQNGHWTEVPETPEILGVGQYYVVIETDNPAPWTKHAMYKKKYPPYKPSKKKKRKNNSYLIVPLPRLAA